MIRVGKLAREATALGYRNIWIYFDLIKVRRERLKAFLPQTCLRYVTCTSVLRVLEDKQKLALHVYIFAFYTPINTS
jgi:hypothetical protein